MSGSSRETLPNICKILMDIQEWSVGPPVCLGVVGRLSRCPGVVGRASRMTGSGREALPNNQKWLGGPPGCPGLVGRPSRLSLGVGGPPRCTGVVGSLSWVFGRGRETLPDVRERLEGPTGCPEVVGRPSRMSRRPRGCPGVVGRPLRMSRSGWIALPDVCEWLRGSSNFREWSGGPSRCPGMVGRPSRMFRSGRRPS